MQSLTLKSFNWIAFLNALAKPESVREIVRGLRWFLILLSAICVIFVMREALLRFANELTQPIQVVTPTQSYSGDSTSGTPQDFSAIVSKNLFGKIGIPETRNVNQTVVAPPATQLQLDLIGTFISTGSSPYAIIENAKKKEQDVFKIGEAIWGEAKLVSIYADRVEIERNGQLETLSLEEIVAPNVEAKGGVANLGNDEFVVQEDELDKALENLPLLLQQARAVPYFKDGRSIGLRLFAIKPDSLFSKLGLNNGDVLRTVNGKSVADPAEAISLFNELKNDRSISIDLERANQPRQFKYQIR